MGRIDKPTAGATAIAAVLAAAITGARNGPQNPPDGAWYARLDKPGYTPPGPVFPVAWTVLEGLLAGAGYRLMRTPDSPARDAALGAWALTLVGLAGYPWLFFGRHRLAASTAASATMLAGATGLAVAARRADRPSALMTAPLVAWLGFATVLSEEIWRKNPRLSRD